MASPFQEVRFPESVSRLIEGGPAPEIDVQRAGAGYEQRNNPHAVPLWRFALDLGEAAAFDGADFLLTIRDFINAVPFGRFVGFRLKFWHDYQAVDEPIGIGDGATTQFQLGKLYDFGGVTFFKPQTKIVAGTPVLKEDGVPDGGYTVDPDTGIATAPAPPGIGVALTWSGEYDWKVRLDRDYNPGRIRAPGVGSYEGLEFQELRP